ncbi:PAN domain-containing protein 1 [Elsinoe fawcettii]|nr:PAN domain-containing protein 1 [Elsinoe fawcettii]
MWSPTLISLSLPVLFLSVVSAQSITPYCPDLNNQQYTQPSSGQVYTILCNQDTAPGAYATNSPVTSLSACITLCDNAGAACRAVSYTPGNQVCYLKNGFTSASTSSGVYSAVRYIPPVPYPVPQANYVNSSTGCGVALPSGQTAGGATTSVTYNYNGVSRSYTIRIPTGYDVAKAAPLILSFHGRGDTATNSEGQTGFSNAQWNPYGIVAYVNGANNQYQGDPAVLTQPSDDIGFVDALITDLQSKYCIDTGRVFASGFSNGGGFSNVLACDNRLSTRINVFAAHSGAFYTSTPQGASCQPLSVNTNTLVGACNPGKRVPIIEFHGLSDGTIPYNGGDRRGYCLPQIPHWASDWASRNGIANMTANTTANSAGSVIRYEWGGPGANGLVTHISVSGADHYWFSTAGNQPIDSTPLIMNHFYRFTNPNGPDFDYIGSQNTFRAYNANAASSSTFATNTATATVPATVGLDGITSVAYPPTCTAINTNIFAVTDTNNVPYLYMCGGGTQGGQVAAVPGNSWRDCFALCDARSDCTGVSFVDGPAFGEGTGNCWLKNNRYSEEDSLRWIHHVFTAYNDDHYHNELGVVVIASSHEYNNHEQQRVDDYYDHYYVGTDDHDYDYYGANRDDPDHFVYSINNHYHHHDCDQCFKHSTSPAAQVTTSSSSSSVVSTNSASGTSNLLFSTSSSTCDLTTTIFITAAPSRSSSATSSTSSASGTGVSSFSFGPTSAGTSSSSSLTSASGSTSALTTSGAFGSSTVVTSTLSSSSSTATALPQQTYPACPGANNSTQTSRNEFDYRIFCDQDSNFASYRAINVGLNKDYSSCFPLCDAEAQCVSFTFNIDTCYLRSGVGTVSPYLNNIIGFKVSALATTTSSISAASSTGAPSNPVSSSAGAVSTTISSFTGTGQSVASTSSLGTSSGAATSSISQSSSSSSSSAGVSSGSASFASSTRTSSSTAAAASNTYPACPAVNNTIQTDSTGSGYRVWCNTDSNAGTFSTYSLEQTDAVYSDCFAICSGFATCTGFSFFNRVCYLKDAQNLQTISVADPVIVGQLVFRGNAPPTSTAPATSTAVSLSTAVISTPSSSAGSASSTRATSSSIPGVSISSIVTSSPASSSSAAASSSTAPASSSVVSTNPATQSPSAGPSSVPPVTPASSNNVVSSTTTSSEGFSTTFAEPAPACPPQDSACGSRNSTVCNDETGTAYYYQCDLTPTGGTIIQPRNRSKRDMLEENILSDYSFDLDIDSTNMFDQQIDFEELAKQIRKRQFSATDFQDCNNECSNTNGCIAFTYSNETSTCTMYSALTGGYATAPGTQFGLAQPSQNETPAQPNTVTETTSQPPPTATIEGNVVLTYYAPGAEPTVTTTTATNSLPVFSGSSYVEPGSATSSPPIFSGSSYVPPVSSSSTSPPVFSGSSYVPPQSSSSTPATFSGSSYVAPASSSSSNPVFSGSSYVPPISGSSSAPIFSGSSYTPPSSSSGFSYAPTTSTFVGSSSAGPRSGTDSTTSTFPSFSGSSYVPPASSSPTSSVPSFSGSSYVPPSGSSSVPGSPGPSTGTPIPSSTRGTLSSGATGSATTSPPTSASSAPISSFTSSSRTSSFSASYTSGPRTITITVTPSTCPAVSRTRTTTVYTTSMVKSCPTDTGDGMICMKKR